MNKILKDHFDKLVLALVLISLVFIYYCVPNVSTNVNKVFAMLVKGDFENIKITPVPNGVGVITTTILVKQLVEKYFKLR